MWTKEHVGLLEQGWGHGCLFCVFSSLPEEELVRRLRKLTLTDDPQEPRRKYASPEFLADLLSSGPEPFVKEFFSAVDGVLFEADHAEVCSLHTSDEFSARLREVGWDA